MEVVAQHVIFTPEEVKEFTGLTVEGKLCITYYNRQEAVVYANNGDYITINGVNYKGSWQIAYNPDSGDWRMNHHDGFKRIENIFPQREFTPAARKFAGECFEYLINNMSDLLTETQHMNLGYGIMHSKYTHMAGSIRDQINKLASDIEAVNKLIAQHNSLYETLKYSDLDLSDIETFESIPEIL